MPIEMSEINQIYNGLDVTTITYIFFWVCWCKKIKNEIKMN